MTGRRIAIYGKGGAGKSTVASNLSVLFAREGRRVLQVGCDPKADSCQLHTDLTGVRPVMPDLARTVAGSRVGPEVVRSHIVRGRTGVDCIEAGGPEPGRGCAGLGISMVLRLLDQSSVYDDYDVVIYDVLGDVVCGGFSVPLRSGKAHEVYVVAAGDVSSLYAANNIARAVRNNEASGVRLAGLVINRARDDSAIGVEKVRHFAARIGTRVSGVIPFDPAVTVAEARGGTATEMAPQSAAAEAYLGLFEVVLADDAGGLPPVSPMSNQDLLAFLRGG